ncbi:protein of unknown function [Clostridium beijerinckii]|nr:protein of unknown function [Clostridium beijerinckii]
MLTCAVIIIHINQCDNNSYNFTYTLNSSLPICFLWSINSIYRIK